MQVTKIKLCNLVPFGSLAQEEEGKGKQKYRKTSPGTGCKTIF